jgi:hypothetical protein
MIQIIIKKFIKQNLILFLLLPFFYSCSGSLETELTALEILDSASDKLSTWKSFRFGLEHEEGTTTLSEGLYQLKSVRGEVVLPRRVKLETNVITFGQLVKLDIVLIDGSSFWTNPINHKWSEIPEGQSPFGSFDVSEVILDILGSMQNPEKINNVSGNIQEISGRVEAKVFEPLVGISDPSKIADVVLSIDLETMNVISARIEGQVNPLDEEGVIRIIDIWDVDAEFSVDPPL